MITIAMGGQGAAENERFFYFGVMVGWERKSIYCFMKWSEVECVMVMRL